MLAPKTHYVIKGASKIFLNINALAASTDARARMNLRARAPALTH